MFRSRALLVASLAFLALAPSACRHRHRGYVEAPPPPFPDAPPPPPPLAHVLNVTGAAHKLTRVTTDAVEEVSPVLSPNGSTLLFEARVSAGGSVVQQTILGVDPHGGARTAYTSGGSRSSAPAWLPDGSFVFVSNASGRPMIVHSLAAVPNAAIAPVVGGDAAPDATRPTASPDGKRIAFEATIRGKAMIGVVSLDGSKVTALGEGHRPAWSPDGRRIVFTRVVNDYSQLFVINAEGGRETAVTSDPSDHDDPAWAPSGKVVVFNSNRGYGRQSGAWNLFAIKPDGAGLVQITDGNADTGEPNWGNDGWIYFASNQSGGYDIWRLRPTAELEALGNQR